MEKEMATDSKRKRICWLIHIDSYSFIFQLCLMLKKDMFYPTFQNSCKPKLQYVLPEMMNLAGRKQLPGDGTLAVARTWQPTVVAKLSEK